MGSLQSTLDDDDPFGSPTESSPVGEDAGDDDMQSLAAKFEDCRISRSLPAGQRSDNSREILICHDSSIKDEALTRSGGPAQHNYLAGMAIKKIYLVSPEDEDEACFLSVHFPGRLLVVETKSRYGKTAVPDAEFTYEGAKYYLTASDVRESGKAFHGNREYNCCWYFLRGESLKHVQYELSKVAHFSALPGPRKLVARLDLLRSSTARKNVKMVSFGDFEMVDEPMSPNGKPMLDGCGFIPDETLKQWLHFKSDGPIARRLAVQVRIFSPRLGIYKGMLVRKPGIQRIQLTPSMRKVNPTETKNGEEWAMVIVKQVHPTKKSRDMGKRFTPKGVYSEVSRTKGEKPLNTMTHMLMMSIGVPTAVLKAYQAQPYNEHAFVVGVADPTGELPEGTVFLTGTMLTEVFVTRCPCVKISHGHVLNMASIKPRSMSDMQWGWLQSLAFGALIFSGKGHNPLPEICAEGDLDGDYYFVCWNADLVRHLRKSQGANSDQHLILSETEDRSAQVASQALSGEWLVDAQRHMTDVSVMAEGMAIGYSYKAWERSANERGMDHPETEKYAQAYLDALDQGKHGSSSGSGPFGEQGTQNTQTTSGMPLLAEDKPVNTRVHVQGAAAVAHQNTSGFTPHEILMQISRADLEDKSLQALRQIIETHALKVKKNTGGKQNRTKADIVDDILSEIGRAEE